LHRIAGVKLHHSLNHVLCYPEFLAPKYRSGHPAGHPKLLQLETPLLSGKNVILLIGPKISYRRVRLAP